MKQTPDRYEFTVEKPDLQPWDKKHNVIILRNTFVECALCGGIFPMSKVGLRRLPNGEIRNQPRCMPCRHKK